MLDFSKWASAFVFIWAIAVPLNGLAVSVTWNWFVAPLLGTRQITVFEGVGLSIFFAVAKQASYNPKTDTKDTEATVAEIVSKAFGQALAIGVLSPVLAIGIAWVWHTFFMSPTSN